MMAPPRHLPSHSPLCRKRKSSTSSESDNDKYFEGKKKKKLIEDKKSKAKQESRRERKVDKVSSNSRHLEERWKHDKYNEDDNDATFVRPFDRGFSNRRDDSRRDKKSHSRSNHYDRHIEDLMDHRRLEREKITLIGVEQVWGKSPAHAEE